MSINSSQGKRNTDGDYYNFNHAGKVAIGNVSTIDDRRSKIVRNRVFFIAICRPIGNEWQSKTLFLAILIRVRRMLRAFSSVNYPMW